MAQASPLAQAHARYPGISLTGAHVDQLPGEQPSFLYDYLAAVKAAGGTQVNVISGYRSPSYNASIGGAQNSNHTRGVAIDSSVYIPGRGWIPGGDLPTLATYGLRSGDQPGFFHNQPDPNHVDAGYLAQGVSGQSIEVPTTSAPSLAQVAAAPATAPAPVPQRTPASAPARVPVAAPILLARRMLGF